MATERTRIPGPSTIRQDINYTKKTGRAVSSESKAVDSSQEFLAASNTFIDIYSLSAGVSVGFKAFLKTFNDSLKLNWNIQEIGIGRMDPLITYKNLERIINVSFTVPAFNLDESKLNFGKLQSLIRFLYPNQEFMNDGTDANATNMVAPPLVKILFMNWIKDTSDNFSSAKAGGLLGYIDGIAFNPKVEQDNYFFDEAGNAYPSNFEISFNFYVLNENKIERKYFKIKETLEQELIVEQDISKREGIDTSGRAPVITISESDLENTVIRFQNPAYPNLIEFSAFLKDFNDKFTSNWNKSDVFAKTDKLATFKNTSRKLNFKFSVPSKNQISAMRNYNRINNLFGILYPNYDKQSNKIVNVPYSIISFKNWVGSNQQELNKGLFGCISELSFIPDLNSGFFIYKNRIYPMNFEVSIDFTVLHTRYLGLSVPYIDKDIEPLSTKFPYSIIEKYFEGK